MQWHKPAENAHKECVAFKDEIHVDELCLTLARCHRRFEIIIV